VTYAFINRLPKAAMRIVQAEAMGKAQDSDWLVWIAVVATRQQAMSQLEDEDLSAEFDGIL